MTTPISLISGGGSRAFTGGATIGPPGVGVVVPSQAGALGQSPFPAAGGLAPFRGATMDTDRQPRTQQHNTDVTVAYTVRQWSDRAHERIDEHMPVFIQRHFDKEMPVYNLVTLGRLNELLRQNWETFRLMTDDRPGNRYFNEKAVGFAEALREYGEQQLHAIHHELQLGETVDAELQTFYENSLKDHYRYLTQFGILHHWAFLGIVKARADAQGSGQVPAQMFSRAHNSRLVLGVTVGGLAHVGNCWGDKTMLDTGSRLWFILKRMPLANGKYGAFQFVPYASMKQDYPPQAQLDYKDEGGRVQAGHQEYVGTVCEAFNQTPTDNERFRAAGFTGTGETADGAYKGLPKFRIAVRN